MRARDTPAAGAERRGRASDPSRAAVKLLKILDLRSQSSGEPPRRTDGSTADRGGENSLKADSPIG